MSVKINTLKVLNHMAITQESTETHLGPRKSSAPLSPHSSGHSRSTEGDQSTCMAHSCTAMHQIRAACKARNAVLDLLSGGQMLMYNAKLAHLGLLEGKVISELLLMVAYKITTRDLSRVGEDKCKTDTGHTKAPEMPFHHSHVARRCA